MAEIDIVCLGIKTCLVLHWQNQIFSAKSSNTTLFFKHYYVLCDYVNFFFFFKLETRSGQCKVYTVMVSRGRTLSDVILQAINVKNTMNYHH